MWSVVAGVSLWPGGHEHLDTQHDTGTGPASQCSSAEERFWIPLLGNGMEWDGHVPPRYW